MFDTSHYLYVLHPTRPGMLTEGLTEAERKQQEAHFQYLKRLHERGVMTFVGRTLTADAGTMGLAVFAAPSEEAARAIMEADPAVAGGLMKAQLYPFRVVFPTPAAE